MDYRRIESVIGSWRLRFSWLGIHIRGFYGRKGFLGLKLLGWMIWMDMR